MTQTPTIEPARPEDYARIGEICVTAYGPSGRPADDPYLQELADTARRVPHAVVLAARTDGAVLGTVTWCAASTPLAEASRDGEGEFRMLAVDPAARRLGLGRALVEACIDRSRSAGHTALALSTSAWMTDAHRLYERLGFVRTPERDWTPRPHIPLITYRLPL